MTHVISILLGLMVAFLSPPASARDAVIGLSPNQAQAVLKSQAEQVVIHLMKTLNPGEEARIFDASKGHIIATFKVPNKKSYANPRAKLQANREAIGKIKRFIGLARAIPGKEAGINLPAFLHAVRQNYPTKGGADLIILGSPVFDESKSPSLSMRNGRVPNDGHVGAHQSRSLFGTKGLTGSLKGYDVYFGDPSGQWSVSTQHSYQMERFISLLIEGHGGSLAYFDDDLKTLFSRAGQDQPDRKHSETLTETDKLEMIQFAPDTAQVADLYSKPLEVEPAPETIWRNAGNISIGITWEALDADLDLYVRPTPSAQVIFFGNASTSEGRLFKDFLASPRTGFETVALNSQIDLSQLRLAVNFYGGSSGIGQVKGELRLAIGNKVWAQPFNINRANGNGGAGQEAVIIDNRAPNNAWLVFDPLTILDAK